MDDEVLYLRSADGARAETLITGPLLSALRTVREVERLADAVENLPDDWPALALMDGTLPSGTCSGASIPATWPPTPHGPRLAGQQPRAARPQPRHAGQTVGTGFSYPVAVSEAHEQAVITGHDREEFRRLTLMLLEQRGLPTPESAKATSKRRPWV